MKKIKFLSMALAVVMLLSVLPLAQVFATEPNAAGTDYVYYVGGTGASNSNNGLSATTPFASPFKVIQVLEAKNAAGELTENDTFKVYITGQVNEHTSHPGQFLFTQVTGSGGSVAPNKALPAPVVYEGVDENAGITLLNNTSGSSTRKYFGAHDITFKNLNIKLASNQTAIHITAGMSNVVFDDCSFEAGKLWRIYSDNMVSGTYKNYAVKHLGLEEHPEQATFNPSVTFKNGDYTNLDEVAAIGACSFASGSNTEKNTAATFNASTYANYPTVNTKIVIGEGAKMDDVYGINWFSFVKSATVEVKAGAQIKELYGAKSVVALTTENAITIDVAEGATVTTYAKVAEGTTFAGTVTDGTETPPAGGEGGQTPPPSGEGGQTPPPAATEATYTYYVSATGDSANDGKTEATAFATVMQAIKAIEALDIKENETVAIKILGKVEEGSSTNQNILSSYTNGSATSIKKPHVAIKVPVLIQGATADAAINIQTISESSTSTSTASTRRYTGAHNLIFKDLEFTTSGKLADVMHLTAGIGSLTFDNVKFAAGTSWRLFADAMVSGVWKGYCEAVEATPEAKVTITPTLVFKNGDYTNVDEVAAIAACAFASGSYSEKADAANYKASNFSSYNCVVNTKVIIENGAKMNKVHGINWDSFVATGTVEVKAGAQVNELIAVGNAIPVSTEQTIYINVAQGATVTTYTKLAQGATFAGTVVDEAQTPPAGGEGGQTPPPGEETPKLPKATYTFYLGGEGASDSNDGLSANKPYKTALKVIKALEAMTFKKDETVLVVINGAVQENGSHPGQHFLCSSEKVKPITAPITFYGADENASFAFVCTTEGHSSTRRFGGPHNITFQNLKIKSVGEATILHISAGLGQYTFDNCSFQTGIKWRFYADSMVGGKVKNFATEMGGTKDKPITINTCITFKNGDYTNLEEVAAIGAPAIANGEKNTNGGTPSFSSSTYASYPCVYNTKIVIGEGAKMSKVYGIAWPGWPATGTVEVQKGAEIASLQGTCDGLNITSTNTIYINVQEGAKVNYKALGANAKFAGTIVKGAPATGDVTMIALPVSFAVLSLAGVVVLKKKYFA